MPEKLDFITPTLMKILLFFFSESMEEFHEREVMRKVKVSKGSANKILKQLAKIDFLKSERKGRMVFYKLNMKNPVVRQFKILVNTYKINRLVKQIKDDSKQVILFGSCSEGTDIKHSDIDLFILTSDKEKVRRAINNFNKESERRVVSIIVDANEFARLRKDDQPLYERIQRGVVLWVME